MSTASSAKIQQPELRQGTGTAVARSDVGARKKTSTACNECKRRKVKCAAGPPPCPPCRATNSECVFEEDQDRRRRSRWRDSPSTRFDDTRLLIDILAILGAQDDSQLRRLVQYVRDELPRPALAQAIREYSLGSSGSNATANPSMTPSSRSSTGSASFSTTAVPFRMTAAPWTTVTTDDHFASELLSLYLAWHHPCSPIFDVESFVDACATQDVDSHYCSPMLVNAIFAIACFWSERAQPNSSTRGEPPGVHFFSEARRLWDDEFGECSVTSMQALFLLSQYSTYVGYDKLGLLYANQACFLYHELGLSGGTEIATVNAEGLDLRAQVARGVATWGLAFANSAYQAQLQRPTEIETPRVPRPYGEGDNIFQWVPYPFNTYPASEYNGSHMNLRCNLGQISSRMQNQLFRASERLSAYDVQSMSEEFAKEFADWHDRMPAVAIDDVNQIPTYWITLRLQYNCLRIALFGYLQAYRAPDPDYGESLDAAYLRHAQRVCTGAANDIAFLIGVHLQLYGQYMPTIICLGSMMSLFTLMEDLNSTKSRSNCVEMTRTLVQASKIFPIARGMLRMVTPTAQQMEIILPGEVQAMLAEFERSDWRQGDEAAFSSVLPNYALRRRYGPRNQLMGELLVHWNQLEL